MAGERWIFLAAAGPADSDCPTFATWRSSPKRFPSGMREAKTVVRSRTSLLAAGHSSMALSRRNSRICGKFLTAVWH